MKKATVLMLCMTMLVSLGMSVDAEAAQDASGILIAYFSRVGNTEFESDVDIVSSASLQTKDGELIGNAQILAQYAQDSLSGDLFAIQTMQAYPSEYGDTTDMASAEQAENARPELAAQVENINDYHTVILVYPDWWGTMPMALFTFLESYDFSGKTIAPLCTHGGSGLGRSVQDIQSLRPDATLVDGLAVRGDSVADAAKTVAEWLRQIGLAV